MKRVIDLDRMQVIGSFDEKDAETTKEKYLQTYDWAGFDTDGDLTVSNDNNE